jgi:hypothetical protein
LVHQRPMLPTPEQVDKVKLFGDNSKNCSDYQFSIISS